MLEIVAGQNSDRAIGREIRVSSRAESDRAHTCERRCVAERAPLAGAIALGEENAIGRPCRPNTRGPLGDFFG